eukprot:Selendium_serpulae@DN2994_c0_g1_i1.p1
MEEGHHLPYVPAEQVTSYTECSPFTIGMGVMSCIGSIFLYVINGELQRIITLGSGSPVYFVIWSAHALQSAVFIPVVVYISLMKWRKKLGGHQPDRRVNTESFQPNAYDDMQVELRRGPSGSVNLSSLMLSPLAKSGDLHCDDTTTPSKARCSMLRR